MTSCYFKNHKNEKWKMLQTYFIKHLKYMWCLIKHVSFFKTACIEFVNNILHRTESATAECCLDINNLDSIACAIRMSSWHEQFQKYLKCSIWMPLPHIHILNDSYLSTISESPLSIDNLKSIKVQYLNVVST